jgi:hypothetical protein
LGSCFLSAWKIFGGLFSVQMKGCLLIIPGN